MSLQEFIRRPIEHIQELSSHMENILSQTSSKHYDYRELRHVICGK